MQKDIFTGTFTRTSSIFKDIYIECVFFFRGNSIHVRMSIVSVNSWTNPSGFTQRAPSRPRIKPELSQSITSRATAASMCGLHHFRSNTMCLLKSEVVRGVQIKLCRKGVKQSATDKGSCEVNRGKSLFSDTTAHMAPLNLRNCFSACTTSTNSTSANHRIGHPRSAKDISVNGHVIESAAQVRHVFQRTRAVEQPLYCRGNRIKSAPPFPRAQGLNSIGHQLFWNSAERTLSTRRKPKSASGSRTPLRSLLYDPVTDSVTHGTRCPYSCRNCFKACLAPENFLVKDISKRTQSVNQERTLTVL